MSDKPIGKITHYYDKIGVAVVSILDTIRKGQMIKIKGDDSDFTQSVESMQIEHQQVDEVLKGQEIGMKMEQPVKEGYLVYSA